MVLQNCMKLFKLVIGYNSLSLRIMRDQLYDVTHWIKYSNLPGHTHSLPHCLLSITNRSTASDIHLQWNDWTFSNSDGWIWPLKLEIICQIFTNWDTTVGLIGVILGHFHPEQALAGFYPSNLGFSVSCSCNCSTTAGLQVQMTGLYFMFWHKIWFGIT